MFSGSELMPDSTSLIVNYRKQSQQIVQSSLPAVFSIENNSHIKAYRHPTQVDVQLDCVILTVTEIRVHQQSLTPSFSNP